MLVLVYFILMLIIGWVSYKKLKGYEDFYVAGKNGNSLQIAGSLLATILGSSAILGSVGLAYGVGWAGAWLMLCASLGLIVLYPFLKYLEKYKNYTLSGLLGDMYGREVQNLAGFVIPIAWLGIVASQIIGASQILMILGNFSYTPAILIAGGALIIYTFLGGQLSIIKTDFVQLIFILLGVLVTFLFISKDLGSVEGLPIINEKYGYLDVLILVLTYSTTFVVGPDIYSRLFCAKDIKVMKKSVLISIGVLIPLAFILASIGVYAKGGLAGVEIGSKAVLLVVAEKKLPSVVSVILYFGLLSAVISSADTTLLTASSMFTQYFMKDLKSEKAIGSTRVFIIVLGILSLGIALYFKSILGTLFLALSIYSGAFIVPVIVGLLGYTAKKEVVLLAIICGGVVALIGKLVGGKSGNYILILSFFLNFMILMIGKRLKRMEKN